MPTAHFLPPTAQSQQRALAASGSTSQQFQTVLLLRKVRLTCSPAHPQAPCIYPKYIAASHVTGQISTHCKRWPFLSSITRREAHPDRISLCQQLQRPCCALLQRDYCYWSQDVKSLREILESHGLEESSTPLLLRITHETTSSDNAILLYRSDLFKTLVVFVRVLVRLSKSTKVTTVRSISGMERRAELP